MIADIYTILLYPKGSGVFKGFVRILAHKNRRPDFSASFRFYYLVFADLQFDQVP